MTQSLLFGPGRGLLAQAAQHFVLRTIRNDTPTFHNDEPVHDKGVGQHLHFPQILR